MSSAAPEAAAVLGELEASNRLLVQQVFKPIANEYRISVPTPGSTEEGRPLLYVKQKKMKIKEDIRFRLSPDDGDHVFMIKSKSVFVAENASIYFPRLNFSAVLPVPNRS